MLAYVVAGLRRLPLPFLLFSVLLLGFFLAHLIDLAHREWRAWQQARMAQRALARGPSVQQRIPRSARRAQARMIAKQYCEFMAKAGHQGSAAE